MAKEGTINVYDLGIVFGRSAALAAKMDYADVLKNAETEDDLLDVISYYLEHDVVIMRLILPDEVVSVFKDGWINSFYDIIFPLRYLA